MNRLISLIVARTKEFYRDRATLIWTFAFPCIVMMGFAYGYSGKDDALLKVGVYPPSSMTSPLLKEFFSISQIQFIPYETLEMPERRVERHQLDLLLKLDVTHPESNAYWINPESSHARLAERLLQTSVPGGLTFQRQELTGKKIRYADWLVPGLVCMNLMFSSLFGVGYAIVRYRKNGVLKRLRATPLSAFEFLLAQVLSRMMLLMITSSLTLGAAVVLIHFQIAGSYFSYLAYVAVGSTALISLALLVAARISSEEVAEGVLNIMTWPMIFLSGIWFSLDGASPVIIKASRFIPLTLIVDGARAILLDGASLSSLMPQMIALGGSAAVLLVVGSLIFKWR